MITTRAIRQIQKSLANTIGAFLVTNPINIYYLTGLRTASPTETESVFLVTKDQSYLIVPTLYEEAAKNLPLDSCVELIIDTERKGLLTTSMNLLPKQPSILIEDNHLSTSVYLTLKEKFHANPLPAKQIIESFRAIKTDSEIKLIQKAVDITDQTLDAVVQWITSLDYTKITETEVAEKIRSISFSLGGEGLGFDTIVASGKNTSQPHYIPQNKKLEKNAPLLIDMGIMYQGYTGDLTRTLFLGKPNAKFRKYYTLVEEAQKFAISQYVKGRQTSDIQIAVVEYFKKVKVDSLFTHSIGHGIGLQIHENPHFSPKAGSELQNNMIVTVEPGLYLEGKFGIRIEDVIQIHDNTPKILSSKKYRDLSLV